MHTLPSLEGHLTSSPTTRGVTGRGAAGNTGINVIHLMRIVRLLQVLLESTGVCPAALVPSTAAASHGAGDSW